MINRFKPDYFRMVPDNESGEFVYFWQHMDAIKAAKESIAPPVNPDTTARLVEALRAIVAWNEAGEHCDEGIPDRILNDANNALQMAQLPVVPVSEDVETIRAKLKAEVDSTPKHHHKNGRTNDDKMRQRQPLDSHSRLESLRQSV